MLEILHQLLTCSLWSWTKSRRIACVRRPNHPCKNTPARWQSPTPEHCSLSRDDKSYSPSHSCTSSVCHLGSQSLSQQPRMSTRRCTSCRRAHRPPPRQSPRWTSRSTGTRRRTSHCSWNCTTSARTGPRRRRSRGCRRRRYRQRRRSGGARPLYRQLVSLLSSLKKIFWSIQAK